MLIVNARFLTQELTGVQRFAVEISKQLKRKLGDQVVFVSPHNIVLKEAAEELSPVIVGKHTGYLWEQWDLMRYMKANGGHHLLSLCGFAPVFYKNKSWVLHDIQSVRYPQMFAWKIRLVYSILMPSVLKTSKHVFSVSKFSVGEISSHYGIPLSKMSVAYNAPAACFVKKEDSALAKQKYLFAVSSVKANKNFISVLKAFDRIKDECPDLQLFIAGSLKAKQFKDVDITPYIKSDRVKLIGYVSDDDLVKYYSNALALIFPSFYEGFGLPVIEAQACGCPVICSDASSLPEVASGSALMSNPTDIEGFGNSIKLLYNSEEKRQELIQKGYDNISRFSWEKSVDEMLPYL